MRPFFRATDANYRAAIAKSENNGRIPLARLIFGNLKGMGWGFLRPWEQQAVFPDKGAPAGIGHRDRYHEPFAILRVRSTPPEEWHIHRNQAYGIKGRYWWGLVWRRSWGWRVRWCLLDPDLVTSDPAQASDWGDQPGEEW